LTKEDEDELEKRVSKVTSDIVRDEELANKLVTRGELAAVLATIGRVLVVQTAVSRALASSDHEQLKEASFGVASALADMLQALRRLVSKDEGASR
jgi:hypothetical protein